tara:strand:+ start:193 stop:849 length:657 start_codon:yes stop_codon:yes gene_type:complete
MKKLVIFGNSVFAEVALYYFEKFSQYEVCYFASENKYIKTKKILNHTIISLEELLKLNKKEYYVFIAVGYSKMNTVRQKFYNFFKKKKFKFASFIHPNSFVYSSKIGEHNFIMENVNLNPYSEIGDNNIIWSSSILGHHSKLGSNNFLSGNSTISGKCIVKDNCFFGVNSSVKDSINIKNSCFIDANEYVNKNLDKYIYFNSKINPRNILKTNKIFNV